MTTTLKTVNGDGSTATTLTPLMVDGLDWEQPLNRTAFQPVRDAYTRLQLGTVGKPKAMLTILLGSLSDLTTLRTMYGTGLVVVLTDTDLGLTWRHHKTI